MKNFLTIIIVLLALGGIGGYIYWQQHKKQIVKESIDKALKKKTDSLYYIHYDSSKIDEITGSASFYNVSLQSDSAQKELLKQTDSLPNVLYNIRVDEVSASGVDIPGLLQSQNLKANRIILNKPIIQVINTGADKPKPFTYNDTLELYEKILGRFKSIRADTIQISNGSVLITNREGKALTTLENINVNLNNFLVDSLHNYENIISYFIKDIRVTVDNIQLPESMNDTRVNIGKLDYDAVKKTLVVKEIQQYKTGNINPLTDLKNIRVDHLNTDAFILNHQLKAGMISCDGGLLTVYKRKKATPEKERSIAMSSSLIDEVQLAGLNLGNTKIIIADPAKPDEVPLVLNDVKFVVSKVADLTEGSRISDIISDAEWKLSAGNISILTKDKLYRITANEIVMDNTANSAGIGKLIVAPLVSEAAFARQSKHQQDRYDLVFNNIALSGINFKKLIADSLLEVDEATLQPVMKIFNDRTVPIDTRSKVGKYPNQQLLKLDFPLYIKKMLVNDAYIAYKEKADKSKLPGTVFFTHVNGIITNVTNTRERIKIDPTLVIKANGLFLGSGKVITEWKLPLNPADTTFTANGSMGPMPATVLNQLIEPLAMASIKEGRINKVDFDLIGSDHKAAGNVSLLYNDLKIELLKKGDGTELKTKEIASILANSFIKNNNPQNGDTRKAAIDYSREINKSFFNLLWKSVFSGAKKIALGKKE